MFDCVIKTDFFPQSLSYITVSLKMFGYIGTELEMFTNEIWKFAQQHEERLLHLVNVEAIQLLDSSEIVRRLKRKKPFELV